MEPIDAGDQGTIEVRAWYADNKGIAIIDNPNGDMPYTLEVLVARLVNKHRSGYIMLVQKGSKMLDCLLRCEPEYTAELLAHLRAEGLR